MEQNEKFRGEILQNNNKKYIKKSQKKKKTQKYAKLDF